MLISIFLSYPYIKDPFGGFKGLHMELELGPDWNWAMQAKRSGAINVFYICVFRHRFHHAQCLGNF